MVRHPGEDTLERGVALRVVFPDLLKVHDRDAGVFETITRRPQDVALCHDRRRFHGRPAQNLSPQVPPGRVLLAILAGALLWRGAYRRHLRGPDAVHESRGHT